MKRKTVSLYGALPSSRDRSTDIVPPSDTPKEEPKARKVVSEPIKSSVSKHEVQGVSVQKRSDHFYLIVLVFMSFCVVSGLVGFKLGKESGYKKGREFSVDYRSQKQLGELNGSGETLALAPKLVLPKKERLFNTSLPHTPRALSSEQKESLVPAGKKKKYTLQVQTIGKNHRKEIRSLTETLRNKGFEVFDRRGVVYVGRFVSTRSPLARKTKSEIRRTIWKKKPLDDCLFVNLPK